LNGSCDLAMVIRSIVLQGSHATIGTGGGITSGSIASDEWDETVLKAEHLLRALGLST
jgi:anthranilate/para-aminobenzoate synthase component I